MQLPERAESDDEPQCKVVVVIGTEAMRAPCGGCRGRLRSGSRTSVRTALSNRAAATSAIGQEEGGVPFARGVGLAGGQQPVAGEVVDRLEQPVAIAVEDDERLVDEVGEEPEDLHALERSSPAQTSSAASSVNAPEKAASRRNRICSASLSRSWLHSTEACSVCWRATAVRAPPVRRRNRSARPGQDPLPADSDRTRAAASSMARGRPSSRLQIGGHDGGVGGVDAEVGPGLAGPVDEEPHALPSQGRHRPTGRRLRSAGSDSGRHPPGHLSGYRRAVPGWWRDASTSGQARQQAVDQRRRGRPARARSCRDTRQRPRSAR